MLSQTNEALWSAAYVENYLDCTENVPDELQRHLSRMRELDVEYQSFVATFRKCMSNHLDTLRSNGEDTSAWRRALLRAQNELIAAQEVGDEKMNVMYQLQDHIENKIRQMDIDFRKLDYGKDQENTEPNKDSQIPSVPVSSGGNRSDSGLLAGGAAGERSGVGSGGGSAAGGGGGGSGAGSGSGGNTGERTSKRSRRTRTDNVSMSMASESNTGIQESGSASESRRETSSSSVTNSASAKKTATTGGGAGKKKKRKSRGTAQSQTSQQSGHQQTPPREDEMAIDPDEPTYCLCDQISFGEMILCDNDLCPIEWFHFGCVSLSTKPKGKWYCPKCRGDRPNVMKPKSVFLKELERYNKEKEEKS